MFAGFRHQILNGTSLSLPFSTMSSGADLLAQGVTFARAGLATQYDTTGKLTWAPNNLLTYSNAFTNAAWSATNITVSDMGDGSWNLVPTAVMGNHRLINGGATTAAAYTMFTIEAKANGYSQIAFRESLATGATAVFDLSNGTVVGTADVGYSFVDTNVVALANGWYRVSGRLRATGGVQYSVHVASGWTPVVGEVGNNSFSGDGTSGILIRKAQFEAVTYQTTPRPYVATTSAAYYAPRFDYDPVTLAAKGLLIEEARTNAALQSNDFSSASWNKLAATVTSASGTAPDGTNTFWLLKEDATTSRHIVYQSVAIVSASVYSYSVYAKAGTRSIIYLKVDNTAGKGASFNLATGAVGATAGGATASILPVGNGVYRCTMIYTSDTTNTINMHIGLGSTTTLDANGEISYLGDNASGAYIFGAQHELGSFATSYIPTTSASVTRAAETASITGAAFTQFYNAAAGTFIVELSELGYGRAFDARGTGQLYMNATNPATFTGSGAASSTAASYPGKIGLVYDATGVQGSANGGAVSTLVGAVSGTITYMDIGSANTAAPGAAFLNGHIKSLSYYKTRKDNATLQLLTAPNLAAALALDLDFTTGTLDPRITFARAGGAMQYDATGKLTWAPENLLLNSSRLTNTYWQEDGGVLAGGVSDPFGGASASTYTANRTDARLFNLNAMSGEVGRTYITSWWMRRRTGSGAVFMWDANNNYVDVTSQVSSAWSRVLVKSTAGATPGLVYGLFKLATSGDQIDIYAPQTERVTYQTQPRDYLPTTSAAAYQPRFDFDPVTLLPKGLLIEESRTNLAQQSNLASGWVTSGSTVTINSVNSPDGTLTGVLISATSIPAQYYQTVTVTAGSTYNQSLYLKAGTAGWAWIGYGGAFAYVNLATGALGTVPGGVSGFTVSNVGGGWYRVSGSFVPSGTSTFFQYGPCDGDASQNVTAGRTVYVWGAQLELGSFATSYIPTQNQTGGVTRAADTASITGANFASWWNATGGTFAFEYDVQSAVAANQGDVLRIRNPAGTGNFGAYTPGGPYVAGNGGLSLQLQASPTALTPGVSKKVAFAIKTSDVAGSAGGGTAATSTSYTLATDMDRLGIGDGQVSGSVLNGHIKKLQFYSVRASDSQLQGLTK